MRQAVAQLPGLPASQPQSFELLRRLAQPYRVIGPAGGSHLHRDGPMEGSGVAVAIRARLIAGGLDLRAGPDAAGERGARARINGGVRAVAPLRPALHLDREFAGNQKDLAGWGFVHRPMLIPGRGPACMLPGQAPDDQVEAFAATTASD